MTPAAIVLEALEWKGTPYHHQASLKDYGADCIGYIVGVARNCGIAEAAAYDQAQDMRGYSTQPNPEVLTNAADKYLHRIEIADAGLADIFVLKYERDPMHFAIITRENPIYIAHAVMMRGCIVEHRLDRVWQRRVVRAYRFRAFA